MTLTSIVLSLNPRNAISIRDTQAKEKEYYAMAIHSPFSILSGKQVARLYVCSLSTGKVQHVMLTVSGQSERCRVEGVK